MIEKQKGLFDKILGITLWVCLALLIGISTFWYLTANNILPKEYNLLSIFGLLFGLSIISGFIIPILVAIVLILLVFYLVKQIRKK